MIIKVEAQLSKMIGKTILRVLMNPCSILTLTYPGFDRPFPIW